MSKSNKGFTLLELAVVLVLIAASASLAIMHYGRAFEKARADQAKQSLWEIRVAWAQYAMNHRDPTHYLPDLDLDPDVFPPTCRHEQYFSYSLDTTYAIATRCTHSGKPPQSRKAYRITLDLENSTWGGTPGYY